MEIENGIIKLTHQEFDLLVKTAITTYLTEKNLEKIQLSQKEAFRIYGEQRVKFWIKNGLLKAVSQNGKGHKIYYDHKKIIKLSRESYHL